MIFFASRNAPKELDTDGLLRTLALLHPLVLVGDANSDLAWLSDQCSALCAHEEEFLGRPIADFFAALSDSSQRKSVRQSISCIDVDSMHAGDRLDSHVDLGTRQGKPCKINLVLFGMTTTSGRPASIWILHFDDEAATTRAPALPGDATLAGAVFEFCPYPLFAIDRNGLFVYANSALCSLLGIESAALRGQHFALFRPHCKELEDLLAKLGEDGHFSSRRVEFTRPGDATAWLSASAWRLKLGEGNPAVHLILLAEPQDAAIYSRDLKKENMQLESDVGKLCHDLRSPLASSLGFARLLHREYGDALGKDGRHIAERVEQGVRAINELLDEFLERSAIDAPPE
jgi:PAS domain S-box-containing protein